MPSADVQQQAFIQQIESGMQGVIQWVGQPRPGQEPPTFEARLYDRLFSTQTPGSKKKKSNAPEENLPGAEEGTNGSTYVLEQLMWVEY